MKIGWFRLTLVRTRVVEPARKVAVPRAASRLVVEMPLLMVLVRVSACIAVTTSAMLWPAMSANTGKPTDLDTLQKVSRLGTPRVLVLMLSVQRVQPVGVR